MSQASYLKIGAVAGGVTITLSLLSPLLSGVLPETVRGFLFQTYQDPLGAFINEMIIVWFALNAIDMFPAIQNFTSP